MRIPSSNGKDIYDNKSYNLFVFSLLHLQHSEMSCSTEANPWSHFLINHYTPIPQNTINANARLSQADVETETF